MSRIIIVSDLHIDTWDDRTYGAGDRSKTKLQHWCDFLDWCEQAYASELIINGDLMDAPPYEGNVSFRSATVRQAVERLIAYAREHRVTYLYGNHDIGISGIRCAADASLSVLQNVNLVYPDYVVETIASRLLIQHGHFYDPALVLYVGDLDARTYYQSHFQSFQWVQQWRDPATGARLKTPGVESPALIGLETRSDNIYYAIKVTDYEAPASKAEVAASRGWVARLRQGVIRRLRRPVTHFIWWEAAKSVFEDYLRQHTDAPSTLYCIMGHTHVPDTGDERIDGRRCLYFNSGTWTGDGDQTEDRAHATYLDVDPEGKVWIQDWIRDPYPK